MAKKIVAILGGYRRGGMTEQAVAEVLKEARARGAETSTIRLTDRHIDFCMNCRSCTQDPGEKWGECIQIDDMRSILEELDSADGVVLAAPVNFFNVNAITRRFIERLICLAYWPWGRPGPDYRIKKPRKKAVLVTSSAMPSLLGRLFTGALRALRKAARCVGAAPVGTLFIGCSAKKPAPTLPPGDARRARKLAAALLK